MELLLLGVAVALAVVRLVQERRALAVAVLVRQVEAGQMAQLIQVVALAVVIQLIARGLTEVLES
jgi:hypothetical protein